MGARTCSGCYLTSIPNRKCAFRRTSAAWECLPALARCTLHSVYVTGCHEMVHFNLSRRCFFPFVRRLVGTSVTVLGTFTAPPTMPTLPRRLPPMRFGVDAVSCSWTRAACEGQARAEVPRAGNGTGAIDREALASTRA